MHDVIECVLKNDGGGCWRGAALGVAFSASTREGGLSQERNMA